MHYGVVQVIPIHRSSKKKNKKKKKQKKKQNKTNNKKKKKKKNIKKTSFSIVLFYTVVVNYLAGNNIGSFTVSVSHWEMKFYLSNILSDTNCDGSKIIKICYLSYFKITYINIMWDETSSGMNPPSKKPPRYETEMGRNLHHPYSSVG